MSYGIRCGKSIYQTTENIERFVDRLAELKRSMIEMSEKGQTKHANGMVVISNRPAPVFDDIGCTKVMRDGKFTCQVFFSASFSDDPLYEPERITKEQALERYGVIVE